MGEIKQLKDGTETTDWFPVTKTQAVYDNDGNRLDNTLSSINDSLANYKKFTYFGGPYDSTEGINIASIWDGMSEVCIRTKVDEGVYDYSYINKEMANVNVISGFYYSSSYCGSFCYYMSGENKTIKRNSGWTNLTIRATQKTSIPFDIYYR